jgi:hypothetical protein
VDGASLVALVLEVRDEFVARPPCEAYGAGQPNSLRLTAIDVFEGRPPAEQVAVIRDLMDVNRELVIRRSGEEIFAHSDTPASYLTDLVCEAVSQILERDPSIHDEDRRRVALAVDSELAE